MVLFQRVESLATATVVDAPAASNLGGSGGWDAETPGAAAGNGLVATAATATTIQLTVADEEALPAIAERALGSGARLYALTPRRVSLEELFLDVVGREDSGQ